jgi:hypothetical protein
MPSTETLPTEQEATGLMAGFLLALAEAGWTKTRVDTYTNPAGTRTIRHGYASAEWRAHVHAADIAVPDWWVIKWGLTKPLPSLQQVWDETVQREFCPVWRDANREVIIGGR